VTTGTITRLRPTELQDGDGPAWVVVLEPDGAAVEVHHDGDEVEAEAARRVVRREGLLEDRLLHRVGHPRTVVGDADLTWSAARCVVISTRFGGVVVVDGVADHSVEDPAGEFVGPHVQVVLDVERDVEGRELQWDPLGPRGQQRRQVDRLEALALRRGDGVVERFNLRR